MVADIGDVLGHFYPRPPRGGRPLQPVGLRTPDVISIHALREEGDQRRRFPRGVVGISIHALREEGDKHTKRTAGSVWHFYPRPPRGGRLGQHTEGGGRFLFLSTPSARRATLPAAAIRSVIDDFYPRPPRGGRPHRRLPVWLVLCHFYPRPPRGGRLRLLSSSWIWPAISIHALREEGDQPRSYDEILNDLFLSTPSARRATAQTKLDIAKQAQFLSTPSARRATPFPAGCSGGKKISIHALREEGDSKNGEKHLRFCFIIKRSAQIWKSLSKNIRKNSCDLHRTA